MDKTELLIELVKKNPVLYDCTCDAYKRNKQMKEETWQAIADELNMTADAVRNKWKHIRDYYVRHKRAISIKGQGKNDKWPYTVQCEFLDNYTLLKKPVWHEQTATSASAGDDHDTSSSDANTTSSMSYIPFETLIVEPPSPTVSMVQPIKLKREECNDHVQIEHEGVSASKKARKDETIDHLFLSYAGTFKKFSAKNQIRMKVRLAEMFAETEMEELEEETGRR